MLRVTEYIDKDNIFDEEYSAAFYDSTWLTIFELSILYFYDLARLTGKITEIYGAHHVNFTFFDVLSGDVLYFP